MHLTEAWGRAPSHSRGDVFGNARTSASAGREADTDFDVIDVLAFYGESVPPEVLDWFRREFPSAEVRPVPTTSRP